MHQVGQSGIGLDCHSIRSGVYFYFELCFLRQAEAVLIFPHRTDTGRHVDQAVAIVILRFLGIADKRGYGRSARHD